MNFADLGLSDELLQAVEAPAIPAAPRSRRRRSAGADDARLIAIAQTGNGQDASLCCDDRYPRPRPPAARGCTQLDPRATSRTGPQVAENFGSTASITTSMALLIGGVRWVQVKALDEGSTC